MRACRILLRLVVVAGGIVAFGSLAGSALASRAEVVGGEVYYFADPGEANNVTISSCLQGGWGCGSFDVIDITDPGARITSNPGSFPYYGCMNRSSNEVRCYVSYRTITGVGVVLGDQPDRTAVDPSVPSGIVTWMFGQEGPDVMRGGPTIDNLYGGDDRDWLFGEGNCDNVEGQNDDDILDGGPGPDMVGGGPGTDVADYSRRTAPVFVAMDGPVGSDPFSSPGCNTTPGPGAGDGEWGEGDNVWDDVENLFGGAGNDTLTGNRSNNSIHGFGGNDDLDGGPGADILNGGDGLYDWVDYGSRSNGVWVTLGDGTANDGENGERDNVVEVENAAGGSGYDSLTGSDADNILDGGKGNDTITGGGGDDFLNGGADLDTLRAQDGSFGDRLWCGSEQDNAEADAWDGTRAGQGWQTDSVDANCENVQWAVFEPQPIENPRWW